MNELQFLIYTADNEKESASVIIRGETIWASQKEMAKLFDVGVPAISKHLKNIFDEGELDKKNGYFQNGNNHSTWCYCW
ncbi:hypothetical protein [Streptococcus jiangjianxini]|uniref:hypothetical protein n=1 Tax=Streptococcus jiangjianxini TaxID=3161189 RepID=UPI00386E1C20